MERAWLSTEEERAWTGLMGAVDSLPVAKFDEPAATPGGWLAKLVLYHVGAWCDECARQLATSGSGAVPSDLQRGVEAENHLQAERSRDLTADQVLSYVRSSRRRMLDEWRKLAEVTPAAWEWFHECGPVHYRRHESDLRNGVGASRGGVGSGP